MHEEWDYLIILDACRYDYFERVYSNYLQGKLSKKISIGSSTNEWIKNTFKEAYDDVVYISSNPRIASKCNVKGFIGGEHFYKVYDIWKDHWDSRYGTVFPDDLTQAAIDIVKKHDNKRFIIHYLQPHAPYLSLKGNLHGFSDPNFNMEKFLYRIDRQDQKARFRVKILSFLLGLIEKHRALRFGFWGDHPEWILRQFLGLSPKTPMDAVRRKYGCSGLRKAYEENLKIVLEQVKTLVDRLIGKIVVTSDHGERLGEYNYYMHVDGSTDPILVDVPWLVISKEGNADTVNKSTEKELDSEEKLGRINKEDSFETEEEDLTAKLRALGYFD